MFLVFISETWLPYICTQVKGRTEIIWDSLAECEKERGWGEWMCSTFGLVSLDSSSNEELPGWTANKDIREEKISRFFCSLLLCIYICLHTFLFSFTLLHYSLSPFVLFHLSVSSCQGSSLASAGRQTGWKQRTSGSRSVCERERERREERGERREREREREREHKHVKWNKHWTLYVVLFVLIYVRVCTWL